MQLLVFELQLMSSTVMRCRSFSKKFTDTEEENAALPSLKKETEYSSEMSVSIY
jgi:hypothetical protein